MSRDTARKVLEIESEPVRDAELREILGREGCLRELIEAILRAQESGSASPQPPAPAWAAPEP
jgi:hypothetical protein